MKNTIMTLVLGFALATSASADQVNVKVKGMVCSFCAQGIKKKLEEQGVDHIDVKLNDHQVQFNSNTMTDDQITSLLKDSGYGVETIDRLKN